MMLKDGNSSQSHLKIRCNYNFKNSNRIVELDKLIQNCQMKHQE